MKKKHLRLVCTALALCAALLTGCGGSGTASKSGGASKDAVRVNSMEAFFEAIQPGAKIVLDKGNYNMSEYIEDIWRTKGQAWNAQHRYVELSECYDGVEAIIKDADNLTIYGGGTMSETTVVIEPRYATVLTFTRCDNLSLFNLTLGHTETGDCAGSVVRLSACEGAELRNMDLYGCGVIALECTNDTQDVYVYDSTLRDCSYGPLDIYDATGKIELRNCVLTGSDGGGFYNSENRAELAFYNCVFGEQETNFWSFVDGVKTEDCSWSEITEYADYEDEDYEGEEIQLDTNALTAYSFSSLSSGDTYWIGYATVNPETGEPFDLPSGTETTSVSMFLRADGTGSVTGYYADRSIPFLWEQDKENPAKLNLTTLRNEASQITVYQATSEEVSPSLWLSLQTPEGLVWMY